MTIQLCAEDFQSYSPSRDLSRTSTQHLYLPEYEHSKCNLSERELLILRFSPAQVCDSKNLMNNTSTYPLAKTRNVGIISDTFFFCHYTNYQQDLSVFSPQNLSCICSLLPLSTATMLVQSTVNLCLDSCLLTGLPASCLTYL